MGFREEIKEQALIASARRCCVCKEYKGRNIEVHHIIHANDGGDDSFENAIPLCFDCHANAGHYNSKHPRGTKFAPDELRKHRDLWYELVKNGKFTINNIDITQQFFITNSFDIVFEIVNENFANFLINEVKLYQNELFHYLKAIEEFSNRRLENYNYYSSFKEYKDKFPDSQLHKDKYIATHWSRIPTIDELKEKFEFNEYVVNYMLANNAKPEDIARVNFSEMGCADANFEYYELREAKVVLLSLFNSTEKHIGISNISEIFVDDGGFIPLSFKSDSYQLKDTNNLILEPGKCLLIPYCILLSNFDNNFIVKPNITYNNIDTGQSQDVRPVELINGFDNLTIGPRNFINQIQFQIDGFSTNFPVKTLDLKNLLLISRFWNCGSCPLLFGKRESSQSWEYICEVFSNNPDTFQEFYFDTKNEAFTQLKIVELENEITRIDYISINNKVVCKSLVMNKGDEYLIDVRGENLVRIVGQYSLIECNKYVNDEKIKRQKISFYITDN